MTHPTTEYTWMKRSMEDMERSLMSVPVRPQTKREISLLMTFGFAVAVGATYLGYSNRVDQPCTDKRPTNCVTEVPKPGAGHTTAPLLK